MAAPSITLHIVSCASFKSKFTASHYVIKLTRITSCTIKSSTKTQVICKLPVSNDWVGLHTYKYGKTVKIKGRITSYIYPKNWHGSRNLRWTDTHCTYLHGCFFYAKVSHTRLEKNYRGGFYNTIYAPYKQVTTL